VKELENRLKIAESEASGRLDLSELAVKPEDTAGTPSGWSDRAAGAAGF
jgi:hypothetical protein